MDQTQFQQFMATFTAAMQGLQTSSSVVNTPLILNFEPFKKDSEKFTQYRKRFENFAEMKGITSRTMKKKTFLNCIGSETYELAKSINAPDKLESLTYDQIVESLEKYLSPAPNKLIEQHRFLSRVQEEKESIGEYMAALRKFLTTCGFNCSCGKSVVEIFLRAQFIRGIKDSSIREKLLQEKDIEFQAAVDKALALEISQLDSQKIKKAKSTFSSSEVKEVNRVSRAASRRNQENLYRKKSRSESRSVFNRKRSQSKSRLDFRTLGIEKLCIKCGRDNHNSQNCKIPANKLKCDSCNKVGHVSRVCISTLIKKKHDSEVKSIHLNKREAEINVTDYSSLQDLEHIEQVTTIDLFSNTIFNDSEKYFTQVQINGKAQQFEVDSGCGFTL